MDLFFDDTIRGITLHNLLQVSSNGWQLATVSYLFCCKKKNDQKKKKSQNTILTKSNLNGRLEPICNFITILLHE